MKIKVTVLFILASIFGFSQDIKSMKVEVAKMYEANVKLNSDEIVDFLYPKMFDFVTKEEFKNLLDQSFNNEDFTIEFQNINPNFINSEIKKIDNKSFILLQYDYSYLLKFKKDISENATEMIEVSKKSIGANEGSYDRESNTIKIKKRQYALAIADELTNFKWKFIYLEKDQTVLRTVIDETILKKLGLI